MLSRIQLEFISRIASVIGQERTEKILEHCAGGEIHLPFSTSRSNRQNVLKDWMSVGEFETLRDKMGEGPRVLYVPLTPEKAAIYEEILAKGLVGNSRELKILLHQMKVYPPAFSKYRRLRANKEFQATDPVKEGRKRANWEALKKILGTWEFELRKRQGGNSIYIPLDWDQSNTYVGNIPRAILNEISFVYGGHTVRIPKMDQQEIADAKTQSTIDVYTRSRKNAG